MKTQKKLNLGIILDKLTDLGWEYTCNCMTRSGMQTYDELMQYIGVLESNEHWNEDAYKKTYDKEYNCIGTSLSPVVIPTN